MKRIGKIFTALAAVCILTGYFFNDLVLSEAPQMMTWDEFSANPAAVARFRDHVNLGDPGAIMTEQETRRAFERYTSSAGQANSILAGIQDDTGGRIQGFKTSW